MAVEPTRVLNQCLLFILVSYCLLSVSSGLDTYTLLCDVRTPSTVTANDKIWRQHVEPNMDDVDKYIMTETDCRYAARRDKDRDQWISSTTFKDALELRFALRSPDHAAILLKWGTKNGYHFWIRNAGSDFTRYVPSYEMLWMRSTPNITSGSSYTPFFIQIENGTMKVGKLCDNDLLITRNVTIKNGDVVELYFRAHAYVGAKLLYKCPADDAASASLLAQIVAARQPKPKNICILPPYPVHGTYMSNIPNGTPGSGHEFVAINITCERGYRVEGSPLAFCYNGWWPAHSTNTTIMPKCVALCHLPAHESVEYSCAESSWRWEDKEARACAEYEPVGAVVRPVCRENYYSPTPLKLMRCIDGGDWTNFPRCVPECGTLTPRGTLLLIGGKEVKLGEIPWHTAIYTKAKEPYEQICGGSLISATVVISAAHCFWSELTGALPATNFAVAVGKLYRDWDSSLDTATQRSDVSGLYVGERYRGSTTNFQHDIAALVLSSTIKFQPHVRPVCLHYEVNFERRQLSANSMGLVAGWGLSAEASNAPSTELRALQLPYVPYDTCIDAVPADFRPLLTDDKICAGLRNGSAALCRGDSGGGLTFPEWDKGVTRYYLRGVASTAPPGDQYCNAHAYAAFTRLSTHQHFINKFWSE